MTALRQLSKVMHESQEADRDGDENMSCWLGGVTK